MDTHADTRLNTARRIYQLLILVYPPAHRQEYGPWMVQLFCDQYREAQAGDPSPGRMAWFWLHTLADLAGSVLREQWAELRRQLAGAITPLPGEHGGRGGRIANLALSGLALIILTILTVWFFGIWLGWHLNADMQLTLGLIYLIAYLVIGIRMRKAARKWRARVWLVASVATLALLMEPTYLLSDPNQILPFTLPESIFQTVSLIIAFLPVVGLVMAALLLDVGLKFAQQARETAVTAGTQRRWTAWSAAALLGMSGLILAKLLYNLYWDAVWDRTTDAIDTIWLVLPVSAAIFSGALLAVLLPLKAKWIGPLYALLIPALMFAAFNLGKQVDFHQLTAERGASINRAIETYYAREGRYPQELTQLVPGYLLFLPEPVIMAGQTWCYQAGAGYYRLGYLDRDHWSSPLRYGRVLAGKGHLPQPVDVCQPAIAAYYMKYPGIQAVGESYFKPTPTLDLGE